MKFSRNPTQSHSELNDKRIQNSNLKDSMTYKNTQKGSFMSSRIK